MDEYRECLMYDIWEFCCFKGDGQLIDPKVVLSNQDSLEESELRYRRLFEAAQDGILILDAESGAITDVNPFLINLLGYSRQEMMDKKLWEVGAFKDIKASQVAFQALQKNEYIRYKDLPLKAKNGDLIAVEFVSNVYRAGSKKVIQCNIRDITDRKLAHKNLLKSNEFLRQQSIRDHLTGLFNRRYLDETMARELNRASRKNLPVGLIMADVDYFKEINDTFGHAAGDAILRKLGEVLRENVRSEDVASRYGGDEFIILLPEASCEVTKNRAEKLLEIVRQAIIRFNEVTFKTVTLSADVSVFSEDGEAAESILKAADLALYHAKEKGRNQVVAANEITGFR
jgi:diguanylate cyclase (GGDEF)-like protein/PAS domain S-box-containing protein